MAITPPQPDPALISAGSATKRGSSVGGVGSATMVSSIAPTTGPQVTYIRVMGPNNQPIYVEVKEKTKKRSGFSKEDMEKMATTAEDVNKYVIKNLCSGAQDITVDWTDRSFSFILPVSGKRRTLKISDIRGDEKLRDNALNISRILDIRTTTDPSINSNRSIDAAQPLQIDSRWQTWIAFHRLPLNQEITDNQKEFESSLRDGLKKLGKSDAECDQYVNESISKQAAAHHFIHKFRERLKDELTGLGPELPPEKGEVALRKYQKKKQLLENLLSTLDPRMLDTKAIYRSVPYANHDLRGLDEDEQTQLSAISAREMELHLKAKKTKISEGNRVTNRISKDKNVPGDAAITAYAQEKGDLLIHDRWIHQSRAEHEGRELRGSSMEEFIVFNVLNLKNAEEGNFEQAMESLALSKDADTEDTIESIKTAMKEVRADTNDQYDANFIRYKPNNTPTYIHTLT